MCKGRFRIIIIKVGQLKEKCSARNCSSRATRSEKLMAQSQNKGSGAGRLIHLNTKNSQNNILLKKYSGRKNGIETT